jgi:alginate O-acetyltransferase complex protein AlgI
MLFNSIPFLFFFFVVTVTYFFLPYRYRWLLLLCASYFFYSYSEPGYLLLLFSLTLINYYAALRMGEARITSGIKKRYLTFCLLANIGILLVFKYYNFFTESLTNFLGQHNISLDIPELRLLLPIGISFYIFKNMSYAIDVYRGDKTPERHLGIYALYVAFFPQLLAGPIERSTRLIPQFHKSFDFDYERVIRGLKLMFWGLFQKMVIADNIAPLVDAIYNHPSEYQGLSVFLGTFFYAFQIYCDFSGYSDIAIGAAQIMGYKTMDNFNRPYISKSIAEFWRRWHISLSSWFKDYLYIPLGGNRVPVPRWYLNLFVVLLICGFWHGANWTFLVWGGIHGFYLVSSIITRPFRGYLTRTISLDRLPRLHRSIKLLITFFLVCFAWIFFRANTISDALIIISNLFAGWGSTFTVTGLENIPFWTDLKFEFVVSLIAIGILLFVQLMERRGKIIDRLSAQPVWFRWPAYYFILEAILLFGNLGSRQFIYFQF